MAETALLREACEWAASLKLDDIPADVRHLARAQLLSMGAAAHASMRHPIGDRLRRTGFPAGALSGATGWAGRTGSARAGWPSWRAVSALPILGRGR